MSRIPLRRILPAFLIPIPCLLLAQFLYFCHIHRLPQEPPSGVRLVLVYSGTSDRLSNGLDWAKGEPSVGILCSGWDYSAESLEKITGLDSSRFILEDRARTTDQNARYCSYFVEATGEKRAALALPWYHLPRATFLTRYYLMGSGIEVIPYATTPAPEKWWREDIFWMEMMKFWGSLARVVLAWFGVEDWPKPSSAQG